MVTGNSLRTKARWFVTAAVATFVVALTTPPLAAQQLGPAVNLVSAHTPFCVDVRFASRDAGAPLITYFCHSGDNQKFRFRSDGEIRVYGSMCVDAFGGGGNRGDTIGIWTCNGGANQKWVRTNQGEIRGINNRCIDIKNASILPWGELILWDCHGGRNQKWAALTVVNSAKQQVSFNFDAGGNLNRLPPDFANRVAASLNNASPFTMPIGNNLTQVTPLANVTP